MEEGKASYYHDALEGNNTASGQIFTQDSLTAAHKILPMGTKVLVTNLHNQKEVWVTVNDRGPFVNRRIIDLSRSAADSLGMINQGIAKVSIQALIPEAALAKINSNLRSQ